MRLYREEFFMQLKKRHMTITAFILSLILLLSFSISLEADVSTSKINTSVDDQLETLFKDSGVEPCRNHFTRLHSGTADEVKKNVDEEFSDYLSLVEKSIAYRTESIRVASRLKEKIGRNQPLSGADLDLLNKGTLAHLSVRKELYAVAEAHECWVDEGDEKIAASKIDRASRLKGLMLSLSAALVLYDNYLLAISVFDEDDKLRRLLNDRDSGYDIGAAELAKISLSYNSAYNRHKVRRAIKLYEKEIKKMPASFLKDPDRAYLNLLITQSPSYNMTKEFSPLYVVGRKVKFLSAMTTDTLYGLAREGVDLFSKVFGNTVGLIESRKGKLHNDGKVLKQLNKALKAGDIMLEKTPFRLTDKFIPGHWGHAAIWIGTEKELKELGLWDHPLIKRYRKNILAGQGVVEALRSGVEMNSLTHFINVDDLAVLRSRGLKKELRAETIIQVLRQVGKEYDFNFDVETTDKIVCSELVYTSYTRMDWPTEKTLGRATISPDNVASKVFKGGPLDLVLFYHDGTLVDKSPVLQMAKLMGEV